MKMKLKNQNIDIPCLVQVNGNKNKFENGIKTWSIPIKILPGVGIRWGGIDGRMLKKHAYPCLLVNFTK